MKYFLLPLLAVISMSLSAQNFQYSAAVHSVTFSGDSMLTIRPDNSGVGTIENSVHWTDDGVLNPCAFISGSHINAAAILTFSCAVVPPEIFVRGTGPDGINFPAIGLIPAGETLTYPSATSPIPFAENTVRYFEHFTISWEISFDSLHWYSAGNSDGKVYVTWHAPAPEHTGTYGQFKYFLTVFDIACKNADGKTTEDDIIDAIWAEFTDHSVHNYNGELLYYYKDILNSYVDLPTLLKYRDGECYAWAQFFLATLKINGISYDNNYISLTTDYVPNACGYPQAFMVKTWNFGTASSDCAAMPYINVWSYPSETDTSYLFDYADVTDAAGIVGQSAPNPASLFGNHQLCIVNDKYYDASYGAVYETIDAIKSGAFAGWCYYEYGNEQSMGFDYNGDGDLDTVPLYNYTRMSDDIGLSDVYIVITTW